MRNILECGSGNAEYFGMWNAECGMFWNAEVGMRNAELMYSIDFKISVAAGLKSGQSN